MPVDETTVPTMPRIGELFVEAGVVNPKIVSDCLFTAHHAKVPIGKVLVLSGHVSQPDIECALQTQRLIRSGIVNRQSAVRLVRRVHCSKVSIEEARQLEHCERAFLMPFSQIGKLLMAAQIVSEQALLTATRNTTQETPLGKLLIGEGLISKDVLIAAMNCLIFIREKKMSRHQAAQIMSTMVQEPLAEGAFLKALRAHSFDHLISTDTPRLLDLLSSAGLLSDDKADWTLEISVETGRQTGQVLLLYGLVDDDLLESALQLQQMLASGTLKLARGSELLRLCYDTESTLESLLAELDTLNKAIKFLRSGRLLDEEKIAAIAAATPEFESQCGSVLVREGIVSHELLTQAMNLMAQIQETTLTERHAIAALVCSQAMQVTVEEALMHLASELNIRRQQSGQTSGIIEMGKTA